MNAPYRSEWEPDEPRLSAPTASAVSSNTTVSGPDTRTEPANVSFGATPGANVQPPSPLTSTHETPPPLRAHKRFSLFRASEMANEPPMVWLVEDLLPCGALAVLFARKENAKSFLALHLCMCVATGRALHGHTITRQGAVVYVLSEYTPGFAKRLAAWQTHYGAREDPPVWFLRSAVQLHKPHEVGELIREIKETIPGPVELVVFDTLARSFVGGEENSAKEMGMLVAGAGTFQRELGAAVLLVHHTPRNGEWERGNTALGDQSDTEFTVSKEGMAVTVKCHKQRDREHFKPLRFRLTSVATPVGDSLVLEPAGGEDDAETLNAEQRACLAVLAQLGPATAATWEKACPKQGSTFYRYRELFVEREYVTKEGREYAITDSGRRSVNSHSQNTPTELP